MQTRNKIFDDFSQLMTNAMGVAQGAKSEAETAMKSWVDRFLAERNLVTREEFDAMAQMARNAREENTRLANRLAALEEKLGITPAAPEGDVDSDVIGSAEADEAKAAETPDSKG